MNNTSCKDYARELGDTDRSQMGHLSFDGAQLVYSAYNRKTGEQSLNAILCSVNSGDNTISCGSYTVVDNQAMETTLYPGAYPSVALDSTHFYIVAQQSETTFHYLRLADCKIASATTFTCSNQTVATNSDSQGIGMAPRISLSGTGQGARIWMSYLGSSSDTVWNGVYSEIRYCTIQIEGQQPLCQASPYFTAPYSINYSLSSRGHYLDVANNIMLIPQVINTSRKAGVLSFGLTPEL